MSLRQHLAFLSLIPLTFFVTGLLTLGDYGVNGDEPHHFQRGQAFLNYYLTGSETYGNLPGLSDSHATRSDDSLATTVFSQRDAAAPRYSVYQDRDYPASLYLLDNEMGHPPLNDILAATSNRLFYGQLGWLGDLESYHVFEILTATIGIGTTMWWAYLEFGVVAALLAGLALALHPMYLGESRFNIKDPVETTAYAATLFALWQMLRVQPRSKNFWGWVVAAGIAGGIGLGTKFNILFVVPTIGLWLTVIGIVALIQKIFPLRANGLGEPTANPMPTGRQASLQKMGRTGDSLLLQRACPGLDPGRVGEDFWSKAKGQRPKVGWVALGFLLAAIFAFAIFYVTWPYLWSDPIGHTKQVIDYYRGVGLGSIYTDAFLQPNGWDLYPLLDVILRAPLMTLILASIGLAGFVRYWKTPQFATLLLWAIWLTIPILRVSLPHTSLYGATRQIMEYLPAMALFAGVGAAMVVDSFSAWWQGARSKKVEDRSTRMDRKLLTTHYSLLTSLQNPPTVVAVLLVMLYLPIVVTLTRLHPNPQLFYNSLIGGLTGAYGVNFPFWYNTMGNQYTEAIAWLNANAEPGAKVSLVFNDNWFLPPGRLRPDIHLSSHQLDYFSRERQQGEYLISLLPVGTTSWTTDYQSSTTRYLDRFVDPIYTYKVDDVALLKIWRNDPAHQLPRLLVASTPKMPLARVRNSRHLELDFGRVYQFDRLEINPDQTENCQAVTSGYLSISPDGKAWTRLENLEASTEPFVYRFSGERGRFISLEQETNSCLLTSDSQALFIAQPTAFGGDSLSPDR